MAEEVGVHWAVTSSAAETYRRDMEAAKRLQKSVDGLSKAIDGGSEASKRQAKAVLTAAESLQRERRVTEAAAKITKEWGVSSRVASQVARKFKGDVSALTAEVRREAVALDRAQKETRELAAAQRKAAGQMSLGSSIAGKMTGQLAALTGGIFAAATAFRAMRSAVETLTELQDNLLGTKAVTNATAKEMAKLEAEAKRLGATTPRTAVEIAGLQQELGRAGFSVQEIVKATPNLIAFASAGKLGLEEATDVTATIVKAFDLQVEETSRVTDVLATASSSAKTDITQLSEGFKYLTTTAVGTHTSLEVASAALAVVQERGLKAGIGGRSLNEALINLAVEGGSKSKKALQSLGLEFADIDLKQNSLVETVKLLRDRNIDLESAINLVGKRGGRALLNLTSGYEDFAKVVNKNINEAEGSTQRMADTMESELGGASRELKSALEGLQIAFAEGLEPALTDAIEGMTLFAQENQDLISSLGTVAGAILKVVGALVEVAAEITSVLTATKLVRGMAKDIQNLADESNVLRDAIMGWQDAMRSGDAAKLKTAIKGAEEQAASLRAEIKKLADEQASFTEGPGSVRWTLVANKMKPLQEQLTATTGYLIRMGASLDSVSASSDGAAAATDKFDKALKPTNEQLKAAERLERSLITAQQKLDDEMEEAERLYRANAISLDTLTEARKRYDEASQQLRTDQFVELRDRIADAKQELLDLAALEEVDIRIRLDLEKLDVDKILEGIKGQTVTVDPLGLFDVDEIVASYDGIQKSTDEQLRQLDTMAGAFDLIAFTFEDIGGSMGQLVAKLAKASRSISSSVGDIQAGGAMGGSLGALGVVGGVIGIFTEIYGLAQGMLADAKAKRFGLPLTAQVAGGRFRAQAVGTGAVSQAQAVETVAAWRAAINDFRESIGGLLLDLPEIGTRVRNDGKEVELTVGGVVYGIFGSLEEAFQSGLRIAVGQAGIEGIGENVSRALARTSASSMEELLELLPVLRELDDVAAGLTASYSRAKTAADSFRTGLDIEAEKLIAHGAALADVVAWRQREIQAQRDEIRATGSALAGVSTSFGRLREWMDSVAAFNAAQGDEARRLEVLEGAIAAAAESADTAGRRLERVDEGSRAAGDSAEHFADRVERFGERAREGREAAENLGDAIGSNAAAFEDVERAATAAMDAVLDLTDSFEEQVRESVRLEAQTSFLGVLSDFQETYNVQLSGAGDLRKRIAEMEFRGAQIRIALLAEELALNAQLLGLTAAQVNQYRQWAQEVTGATFRGLSGGGRGRKAQAAREAEEEARRAAEEQERMLDTLRDLADEWAAAGQALRDTDLGAALRDLRQRAADAIAEANAAAAADPDVAAALRDTIAATLADQIRQVGQDALTALGNPFRALRQEFQATRREILYMIRHADELGLSLEQVANQVRQAILPGFLDSVTAIAEAHAGTAEGDALAAQAAERKATLERALFELEFRNQILLLETAGAMTPALREMADNALALLATTEGLTEIVEDPDTPFAGWTVQAGRGSGGGVTGGAGGDGRAETFEEFLRRLLGDTERNPFIALEAQFAEIFATIRDSAYTAQQKALGLAAAEEELARRRLELQDREFANLYQLAGRVESELLATQSPKAQLESLKAKFEAAEAALVVTDEVSRRAFEEAAQRYLDYAAGDYAAASGSAELGTTAREDIQAALAARGITAAGLTGIASPTAPGIGSFSPGLASFLPPVQTPIIVPQTTGVDFSGLERRVDGLTREVVLLRQESARSAERLLPALQGIDATTNRLFREGLL